MLNRVNKRGPWSVEEKERYVEARKLYETDWRLIEAYVRTRSRRQCISHGQKFDAKYFEDVKQGRTVENDRVKPN